MTKRAPAIVLVILVVLGMSWLWATKDHDRRIESSPAADHHGRDSGPGVVSPGASVDVATGNNSLRHGTRAIPTPAEIVERSDTFMAALSEARMRFGATDPRVADLEMMAQALCLDDPDPQNALSRKHPDASRAWAVARIVQLCEGFAPSTSPPGDGPNRSQQLVKLMQSGDKDATAAQAKRLVATSEDYSTLMTAGQVLIESGTLPIDQMLGIDASNYGQGDLISAWSVAAQLSTCAGRGGCGPDSLITASFCRSVGCRQGVTFEQAIAQKLPASQYQAAMAFRSWILSQRTNR